MTGHPIRLSSTTASRPFTTRAAPATSTSGPIVFPPSSSQLPVSAADASGPYHHRGAPIAHNHQTQLSPAIIAAIVISMVVAVVLLLTCKYGFGFGSELRGRNNRRLRDLCLPRSRLRRSRWVERIRPKSFFTKPKSEVRSMSASTGTPIALGPHAHLQAPQTVIDEPAALPPVVVPPLRPSRNAFEDIRTLWDAPYSPFEGRKPSDSSSAFQYA